MRDGRGRRTADMGSRLIALRLHLVIAILAQAGGRQLVLGVQCDVWGT